MRRRVTVEKLRQFMEELAAAAGGPGKVYLTGGATALLLGLREQTIDIDIKLDPEPKGVFEAIACLKEKLELNVELASPDDFIPASADWREKSLRIATFGQVEFFHYDFTMQALAKLERGLAQDLQDVRDLLGGGHVTIDGLKRKFAEIEGKLLRYPAIDPKQFKNQLDDFLARN
jgi:hypothetical protein